eukprot:TRINITY_DN16607_c0_g1_i1.p1 TRINITY_DN16607_c0_g1~~TRINITY_DN16607_c0_g1_i1.p1  ORF type:complete len:526 (+),score=136.98 TRINITY_DN16607_c0_g1_i1:94-1671(+)
MSVVSSVSSASKAPTHLWSQQSAGMVIGAPLTSQRGARSGEYRGSSAASGTGSLLSSKTGGSRRSRMSQRSRASQMSQKSLKGTNLEVDPDTPGSQTSAKSGLTEESLNKLRIDKENTINDPISKLDFDGPAPPPENVSPPSVAEIDAAVSMPRSTRSVASSRVSVSSRLCPGCVNKALIDQHNCQKCASSASELKWMEQAKSADDKWREQCFQAQKDKNDKFKKNALEQAKDLEMRRNEEKKQKAEELRKEKKLLDDEIARLQKDASEYRNNQREDLRADLQSQLEAKSKRIASELEEAKKPAEPGMGQIGNVDFDMEGFRKRTEGFRNELKQQVDDDAARRKQNQQDELDHDRKMLERMQQENQRLLDNSIDKRKEERKNLEEMWRDAVNQGKDGALKKKVKQAQEEVENADKIRRSLEDLRKQALKDYASRRASLSRGLRDQLDERDARLAAEEAWRKAPCDGYFSKNQRPPVKKCGECLKTFPAQYFSAAPRKGDASLWRKTPFKGRTEHEMKYTPIKPAK